MLSQKITQKVLEAIEKSPLGIASLDVLKSLRLCDPRTLRTTLSRLGKKEQLIRLKRGAYSTNPMKDALVCAQSTFNGYLGFSAALYVHKLITEIPFTITVVTNSVSKSKLVGEYEFRAVSLGEKAVGFEWKGNYVVSTRAKTLFDCLYLQKYSVEKEKLIEAFKEANLTKEEWKEFDMCVKTFAAGKAAKRMKDVKIKILSRG